MFLSTFDIFKIGIGPSSSHTMGPMSAAGRFLGDVRQRLSNLDAADYFISVVLKGSLALTGHGHGTHRAVTWGLLGFLPSTICIHDAEIAVQELSVKKYLLSFRQCRVFFDQNTDINCDVYDKKILHPNCIEFLLKDGVGNELLRRTYYSIGGGFIRTSEEMLISNNGHRSIERIGPFPFSTAEEMLRLGKACSLSIADMKRANELANGYDELNTRLDAI